MNANPLKASVSLWSADLSNLASEIRRIDSYADSYHLDVSDGTFAASLLLFFPDLVKSIRAITEKPFEVHLMTQQPERWVEPFVAAGANCILFFPETTENMSGLIDDIRGQNIGVGVSLTIETPVSVIEEYLDHLDIVCIIGTAFGVKGVSDFMQDSYDKIRQLTAIRQQRRLSFEIEADGAIRRHTVPRLRQCGADIIVPGSLMFGGNEKETSTWLRSL